MKRFEPDKGFRLLHLRHVVDQGVDSRAHPAFLVAREDGHHREPRRSYSSTCARRRRKIQRGWTRAICAPTRSKIIAQRLSVTAQDVIDMNRRLGGDASLNAPIRDSGEPGDWQDWLVDNSPNPEAMLAEHGRVSTNAMTRWDSAMKVLNPSARSRIFEARAPGR